MKKVKYSNGLILQYDDTLKPGDLITTYNSGFHEFIKFEDRGENETPLAHYIIVFDKNGNHKKSNTIGCCDASYCRRAEETIEKEILNHEQIIENFRKISSELKNKKN